MSPYPFLEVTWDDAVSCSEWLSLAAIPGPARVVSRGWLVRSDTKALVLAASLAEEDFGDILVIPKGMVISKRRIKG